ncbi:MAG: hypothetical protein LBP63_02765 [Prevotellaceae bacterium]|jgi:hypothetical protein|nr:hypothetical protein [Prevotellaceae bacterium]
MENTHLEAIPANILEQVHTKLNEIRTLLLPYVITLTPEERRGLLKMGDKSFTFVEKAYDYVLENPTFVPAYLNTTEFAVDFADAHGLWTVRNDALQVYEMIDDSAMASGSEAMQAALVFYNAVKEAAKRDVPGAKAIYEELKNRFPGHKRPKQEGGE